MFVAEVLSIDADEKYIDEKGAFDISKCNLMAYSNGKLLFFRKENWKIWFFGAKKEKKRFKKSGKK